MRVFSPIFQEEGITHTVFPRLSIHKALNIFFYILLIFFKSFKPLFHYMSVLRDRKHGESEPLTFKECQLKSQYNYWYFNNRVWVKRWTNIRRIIFWMHLIDCLYQYPWWIAKYFINILIYFTQQWCLAFIEQIIAGRLAETVTGMVISIWLQPAQKICRLTHTKKYHMEKKNTENVCD